MNGFSPEFAQLWLADRSTPSEGAAAERSDETLTPSQREALDELAERVSAARSVY
ncbi:MAG TPA: hypothetical protein VET86_00090 [Casimicrobiaceae bacterium]|nr:hypothetical protein [Casimicrobiaceae bacterium]